MVLDAKVSRGRTLLFEEMSVGCRIAAEPCAG